mgnify:CR=1 FL=1
MSDMIISERMPVLPLRGLTVFPRQLVHFDVGREKSVKALEVAMKGDQRVFLVTQKDILDDDPRESGLYRIGTVGKIKQVLRTQGDMVRVLVEGEYRALVKEFLQLEPCLTGRVESVPEQSCDPGTPKAEALMREAVMVFDEFLDLIQKPAQELQLRILALHEPGFLADSIGQHATFSYQEKAKLLAQLNPVRRLDMALRLLRHELEVLKLESEMQDKTREQIDRGQRDYYLREQMKVIRTELGEEDEEEEAMAYRSKIQALHLDQEVEEKLLKDVNRMAKQPFGSAEGAVLRNYLDAVLELPWNKRTRERVDIQVARKILDEDHFGLEKVKERILEVLAVKQMAPELPSQIICLVGPPGVGKTSIAYSIARCLNRNMARISLGGVHDEAEIRGHRKTYVGAMPGRITAALSQAGVSNPLMLLDEIDKTSSDYKGDTSAALLEVLDPEQNNHFNDHYVEVPQDLSEVLFIATANDMDGIPRPLLDRMEVIEISGYTENEKEHIAKDHLIPKQLEVNGIPEGKLKIQTPALRKIITLYTREAGVRGLERKIGQICRKAAREIMENDQKKVTVNSKNLENYLGKARYSYLMANKKDEVGIARGLAWTQVGGDTLQIEVNVMPGKGELVLTGQLGDVMKESAQAGISYIRSVADKYGIAPEFFQENDIHVHIPEGAVPKDGPSAGITMATAMLSAIIGREVRADVAMTGEITLRGHVLPIGGLKEKLLAAKYAKIRQVLVPKQNKPDIQEMDAEILDGLKISFVDNMNEVLHEALA